MKKQITFVLFSLFSPVFVNAWGILDECNPLREVESRSASSICFGEKLLTPNQPSCIALTVKSNKDGRAVSVAEQANDAKEWRAQIEKYFNIWISTIRNTIYNTWRAQEFDDFLKQFPQRVNVVLSDEGTADQCVPLTVENYTQRRVDTGGGVGWTPNACGETSAGKNMLRLSDSVWAPPSAQQGNHTRSSCAGHQDDVFLHEIGHLWGLADLYASHLESAARTSKMAKKFSLMEVNLTSKDMAPNSIMDSCKQENRNKESNISCDDVDGVINMFDVLLLVQGKTSLRWKTGWKSFCTDPKYQTFKYAQGQPFFTAQDAAKNANATTQANYVKKAIQTWYAEAERLSQAVEKQKAKMETFKTPYTAQALMESAKLNMLEQRQRRVESVYAALRDDGNTSAQARYNNAQKLLAAQPASIRPGAPLEDPEALAQATPRINDWDNSQLKETSAHHCVVCDKPISEGEVQAPDGEYVLFAHRSCLKNGKLTMVPSQKKKYIDKYGYKKGQTEPPVPTYAQLEKQLAATKKKAPAPQQDKYVLEDKPIKIQDFSISDAELEAAMRKSQGSARPRSKAGGNTRGGSARTTFHPRRR